jgi:two-component system C4-dicarboxylate transport response regulator DctD
MVGADSHLLSTLSLTLASAECAPIQVQDIREAAERLNAAEFDVVLVDLDMPATGGEAFLKGFRAAGFDAIPIALTGPGDTGQAVRAVRDGA